jgi:hypothetical protein
MKKREYLLIPFGKTTDDVVESTDERFEEMRRKFLISQPGTEFWEETRSWKLVTEYRHEA